MPKKNTDILLKDGFRIGVIGAGPAGSFFSKFILELARIQNIDINLTIFDGKNFAQKGPKGCNMCAGVIAQTLVKKLDDIGINVPVSVIQREIKGYQLHTPAGKISLHNPSPDAKIFTVFRGSGPIYSEKSNEISFDQFLLSKSVELGAIYIPEIVSDIEISPKKATIAYGRYDDKKTKDVDVIVVATGLNSIIPNKIAKMNFGYQPPKMVDACQMELKLPKEFIQHHYKNMIHLFNMNASNVTFGSLIPKDEYVTATVIGKKDLMKTDMYNFLHHPSVRANLPEDWVMPASYCHCHPHIALTPAKKPFYDRLVLIGDANCSRYYKNGLESAFFTAKTAANTIIKYGVSREAFAFYYHRECVKKIHSDNYYGKIVFKLNDIIMSVKPITKAHLQFADEELRFKKSLYLNHILWNMFTGNKPYRNIFLKIISPRFLFDIFIFTLRIVYRKLVKTIFSHKTVTVPSSSKQQSIIESKLAPIKTGQTVVIIGGGPSGASCGIALIKQAQKLRRHINVILYEPKDFHTLQNQCVGVLSPPFATMLKKELDLTIPENIVQKQITGYFLHSANNNILLSGENNKEPTFVVRRADFDKFLLDKAKEAGVQVVDREVTDLEFYPEYIGVFSGSNNHKADVVVAAFGLNAELLELMEDNTPYKRPKCLKSVVTNIYTNQDYIEQKLGGKIHAFIPPIKNVEFAAITPKKDHITVNIAGTNVTSKDMNEFLRLPEVTEILPEYTGLVYFKGIFPIYPAKHFFMNRLVCVGDTGGLIRPLKGKGINSAITTGIKAAHTIMDKGISYKAFQSYQRACLELVNDRHYGTYLRWLCNISSKLNLLDALVELAKKDLVLYRAFYNIVSGDQSYKQIVQESGNIGFLKRLLISLLEYKFK